MLFLTSLTWHPELPERLVLLPAGPAAANAVVPPALLVLLQADVHHVQQPLQGHLVSCYPVCCNTWYSVLLYISVSEYSNWLSRASVSSSSTTTIPASGRREMRKRKGNKFEKFGFGFND